MIEITDWSVIAAGESRVEEQNWDRTAPVHQNCNMNIFIHSTYLYQLCLKSSLLKKSVSFNLVLMLTCCIHASSGLNSLRLAPTWYYQKLIFIVALRHAEVTLCLPDYTNVCDFLTRDVPECHYTTGSFGQITWLVTDVAPAVNLNKLCFIDCCANSACHHGASAPLFSSPLCYSFIFTETQRTF